MFDLLFFNDHRKNFRTIKSLENMNRIYLYFRKSQLHKYFTKWKKH